MSLHSAPILIVESEIGTFITSLQQAMAAAGAESVVARNASEAEQHCDQLPSEHVRVAIGKVLGLHS